MIRLLKAISTFALVLGFLLALPGLLLLLGASQIACLIVAREQAAHDLLIDRECL